MKFTLLLTFCCASVTSNAVTLISEFYGDQPGGDLATQTLELSGTALDTFDLWIVSIESDFASGIVDRAENITGSFDALGIATITISDLENPSFTLVLTDDFTGTVAVTDVDTSDDGVADDLSAFGTIIDAVGVIEDSGDPDYAAAFGGVYLTPYASGDPELVFREGSTGDWYYVDGTTVYDVDANVVDPLLFSSDPTATTFGSINPVIIPEPSSALLGGLGLLTLLRRRR